MILIYLLLNKLSIYKDIFYFRKYSHVYSIELPKLGTYYVIFEY